MPSVATARVAAPLLVLALLAGACSSQSQGSNVDPEQVDATDAPQVEACRVLTPPDVAQPSNATATVDCSQAHTAQTILVADFPAELADAAYDDPGLGAHAYTACSAEFRSRLGADDSTALRTVLNWAWFRPSEAAWKEGARWFRCDVVGGTDQSREFVDLPPTLDNVLQGRPDDRWLVCARGQTVSGAVKVPCSQRHTWRAVTTIKLGEPGDPYPGDRVVEVRTRDFCSTSVGVWLNYPVDYDFAYTWFHEAEWKAGNRRSVCWARTKL
ncbi:MAG: septum formation family protein [Nocardioides sp.]